MAITARVKSQYFQQGQRLIRLAPNQDHSVPTKRAGTPWTPEEHDRFLEALDRYPSGPWKAIAVHIGSRTTRQTMTHAQKYREKIARRQKGKGAAKEEQTTGKIRRLPQTQEHRVTQIKKQKVQKEEKPSQFVELELDECVITLLDTFEPLEMLPGLESLIPVHVADTWCTATDQFDKSEWLNTDSPFQQCIPL